MQPKVLIRCRRLRCKADTILNASGVRVAVCNGVNKETNLFQKKLKSILGEYRCSIIYNVYNNLEGLLADSVEQDVIFYLLRDSAKEELKATDKIRNRYRNSKIIFVAENGVYLKEGYKAQPFRYLYLSDTEDEIREAFDGAVKSIRERRGMALEGNGKYHYILLKDVLYIESLGDEIGIFMIDGKEYILRMPLKQMFFLIQDDFIRFNRQQIVNARYIDYIKDVKGMLVNQEEVAISERERKNVLEKYAEYIGRMRL